MKGCAATSRSPTSTLATATVAGGRLEIAPGAVLVAAEEQVSRHRARPGEHPLQGLRQPVPVLPVDQIQRRAPQLFLEGPAEGIDRALAPELVPAIPVQDHDHVRRLLDE
jgi:hypothetical protein